MAGASKPWDEAMVRKWLEARLAASKLEQERADRRGYEARDEYDQAAAERWVCDALRATRSCAEQATFAGRLKELIGQDEYAVTGIHDEARFERHVRSYLRKLVRMTKDNDGFEKTFRFQ